MEALAYYRVAHTASKRGFRESKAAGPGTSVFSSGNLCIIVKGWKHFWNALNTSAALHWLPEHQSNLRTLNKSMQLSQWVNCIDHSAARFAIHWLYPAALSTWRDKEYNIFVDWSSTYNYK